MNYSSLIIVLLILLGGGYLLGRNKARAIANQGMTLHSLPTHYGALVALWTGLPPLLLLIIWSLFEQQVVDHLLVAQLPQQIQAGSSADIQLDISKVHNLASGTGLSASPELQPAVKHLQALESRTSMLHTGLILALALLGLMKMVV